MTTQTFRYPFVADLQHEFGGMPNRWDGLDFTDAPVRYTVEDGDFHLYGFNARWTANEWHVRFDCTTPAGVIVAAIRSALDR